MASHDAAEADIAENDQVEAAETSGTGSKPRGSSSVRRHGKGFVYLGLKDCDDALRKIDSHAKEMSAESFARALGHDEPKGRFLHKIEAMKAFGLIEPDTAETVRLSTLADDMLYGANKARARVTAFLNYREFKTLYVDFPKAHENQRSDLVNFVKAKLGIVNEVDRFMRLFLESAGYAGLLDGPVNHTAKVVKLRAAPTGNGGGTEPSAVVVTESDSFEVMPADESDEFLDATGLDEFKQRTEVRRQTTGRYSLTVGDGGKITIEITRPIQITLRPENLVSDLPKILEAMQHKGLRP